MKLTKNQLQQLIKEEVVKQKNIMILENKKVRILKELEEMDYAPEDNITETELFSPEELATLDAGTESQTGALEEGKVADFFKKFTVENITNAIADKAKSLLMQKGITTLPREFEKYAGKSFAEIKNDIKSQLPTPSLAEAEDISTKEKVINTVHGWSEKLFGVGAGAVSVMAIVWSIFEQLDKLGLAYYMKSHIMYAIIPTLIALAVYLTTTILKAPYENKQSV